MTKLYNLYFNAKCNLRNNLNNKRGQGMVEYVLIIAFIAIVVMAALTPLGTQIKTKFNEIVTALGGTAAQ